MPADRLAAIGRGLDGEVRRLHHIAQGYLDRRPTDRWGRVACVLLGGHFRLKALDLTAMRGVLLHETAPLLPAKAGPSRRRGRAGPSARRGGDT